MREGILALSLLWAGGAARAAASSTTVKGFDLYRSGSVTERSITLASPASS